MEHASLDRRAGEASLAAPPERPLPARVVVRVGAAAGVIAGVAMIGWQMLAGEIDATPTAVEGVDSSTWTAITAVASLVLGADAQHGWFSFGPVLLGLILLMAYAIALGVLGVALLVYVQGYHPGPLAAAAQGVVYGLLLQIFVVNLTINALQDVNTVYESTTPWSWWAAHSLYGGTLGIAGARMLATAATTTRVG